MKKMHKWFTLVELVVVITILAILGTVALLSFRGYSGDARNSKRITDLNSIKNNVTEQITAWQKMLNFVTSVGENRLNSTPIIAGLTPVNGTDYEAGTVNYPTIGMVGEDFSDPTTNGAYVIGVSTKYKGGAYQVAAKMDPVDDANNRTYILGTYKKRRADNTATTWEINAGTTAGAGTGPHGAKIFTLTNGSSVGVFKVGDTVTCTPACTWWNPTATNMLISKISADGLTVTFTQNITNATTATMTAMALAATESNSLIDENNPTVTADAAIVHDSSTLFPY